MAIQSIVIEVNLIRIIGDCDHDEEVEKTPKHDSTI